MLEDLVSLPGVGSATAKKLMEAGYTTIEILAVTPIRELVSKTNIGENTAKNIVEEARKAISLNFVTAQELFEKRQDMQKCRTCLLYTSDAADE